MENCEGGEHCEGDDAREGGVICETHEAGEACCKVREEDGESREGDEDGEGEEVEHPD